MVASILGDIELQGGSHGLLTTESDRLRKKLREANSEKIRMGFLAFIFLLLFVAFFIFAGETSDVFHDGPEQSHKRTKPNSKVCGAYIHFPGSDYETYDLCPFLGTESRTLTCGDGDSLIILNVGLDGSGVSNAVGKLYQFCQDNWVDNSCSFIFWDDIVSAAPAEERRQLGKGEHAMDNFMATVSYMCRFHIDGQNDASAEESGESNVHHGGNGNGGHHNNNHNHYDYGYYDDYYYENPVDNANNNGPQVYDNSNRRPNGPNRHPNGQNGRPNGQNGRPQGPNGDNGYQRGPNSFDLNHGAHNNEHGAGHGAHNNGKQNQGNGQISGSGFNGQNQPGPNYNQFNGQNQQGFNGQAQDQGFNGQQNPSFQGQTNFNGQGQMNGFNGGQFNRPVVNPNFQNEVFPSTTAAPFSWQNGQIVANPVPATPVVPSNPIVTPVTPSNAAPATPVVVTAAPNPAPAVVTPTQQIIQVTQPVVTAPKVIAATEAPTTEAPTTTQDSSQPMYYINGQPVYWNSPDAISDNSEASGASVDFSLGSLRKAGYDGWHGHNTHSAEAAVDCAGGEEGGEPASYDGFHHQHQGATADPCANAEPAPDAGAEGEGAAAEEGAGGEAAATEGGAEEAEATEQEWVQSEGDAFHQQARVDTASEETETAGSDSFWSPSEGDAFHQHGREKPQQLGCGGFMHFPLTDYETFKLCPFDPTMPQTIDCGSKSTIHILNVEFAKTQTTDKPAYEVTNGITLLYDFCKATWTRTSTECTFSWWGDIVPEQELEEDVVPPKLTVEYLCFHEKKRSPRGHPAHFVVLPEVEIKRKTHGCGKCEEIADYSYCRSCAFDFQEKRELSCSTERPHVLPIHLRVHGSTQPTTKLVSIHNFCKTQQNSLCAFAYEDILSSASEGRLPLSDDEHVQHFRNFPYATNSEDFARWGVILDYVCTV